MTSSEISINIATAKDLLGRWQQGEARVRESALAAFRRLPDDAELALSVSNVQSLTRIYQRRAGRSSDVQGDENLLQTLERLEEAEILGGAASVGSSMVALWIDLQVSEVIGCVIGPDRRTAIEDPADG